MTKVVAGTREQVEVLKLRAGVAKDRVGAVEQVQETEGVTILALQTTLKDLMTKLVAGTRDRMGVLNQEAGVTKDQVGAVEQVQETKAVMILTFLTKVLMTKVVAGTRDLAGVLNLGAGVTKVQAGMVEQIQGTEAVIVINRSPGINQMPPLMEVSQKMLEKEAAEVGVKHLEALGGREVMEVAKEGGSRHSLILIILCRLSISGLYARMYRYFSILFAHLGSKNYSIFSGTLYRTKIMYDILL